MARIINLKVELPADDDLSVAAVKAWLQKAIRAMGQITDIEPAAGQATMMDRTLFLDGATVKEWRPAGERKKAGRNGGERG